jgi:hypothetical protein
VETNVWLPACALAAVKAVAARRGLSRDETIRQLLDEHLEAQELRGSDVRLTHISTVLRYPPTLGRRKHRWVPEFGGPLRLRLRPGVADRARAVSLRLPGQFQRAHRDYQSRQLTDAVMTAIAVQEPFTDHIPRRSEACPAAPGGPGPVGADGGGDEYRTRTRGARGGVPGGVP